MNGIVEDAIMKTNFVSYMSRYYCPVAKSKNTPPILPPSNSGNTTDNKQDVCVNGVSVAKDDEGSNSKDLIFGTKK